MKKINIAIFLLIQTTLFGQNSIEYNDEKINTLDEKNIQTGIWKLYDEAEKVLITCEFENGQLKGDTNHYKDSKLIASYDNNIHKLDIFKNADTTLTYYLKTENNKSTLIDDSGNEINREAFKLYSDVAEVKPMFYGGLQKLYAFIGENIKTKKKGTVKVKFTIDTKGFTKDIQVIESSNEKLNEEAIRVISILPRWQPAYQGGKFVNCQYTIPINIR